MLKARAIVDALCLLIFAVTPTWALNVGPDKHTAGRYELSPDIGRHGILAQSVLEELKYVMDVKINESLNDDPTVRVADVRAGLERENGVAFWHSHGAEMPGVPGMGELIVEPRLSQSIRDTVLTSYHNDGYTTFELQPESIRMNDGTTIFTIAVTNIFIASYFQDAGSLIVVETCYSNLLDAGFVGRRAFIGYDAVCMTGTGQQDVNTLFTNLAGYNGEANMVLNQAWQGTTFASPRGQTNYVLMPIVNLIGMPPDDELAANITVIADFNMPMDTRPAADAIIKADLPLYVRNCTWLNNHQIQFELGSRWVDFQALLTVWSDTTDRIFGAKSWPAGIGLAGNTRPGYPDDNGHASVGYNYERRVNTNYGNPAAVFTSFSFIREAGGVRTRFTTSAEDSTAGFLLESADEWTGPWKLAKFLPAHGPGDYEWLDLNGSDKCRIREVESKARPDTLQVALDGVTEQWMLAEAASNKVEQSVDTDSILAYWQKRYPTPVAPDNFDRFPLVFVCPPEFETAMQTWANAQGVASVVYVIGTHTLDDFTTEWKGHYLQNDWRYVQFVGGTKALQQWAADSNYAPAKPGWPPKPLASRYPVVPSQNILNFESRGWHGDRAARQDESLAWFMPGFIDFGKYVDANNDGKPDVPWAVFPADNLNQLILMINADLTARDMPQSGPTVNKGLFTTSGITDGHNEGPVVNEMADSVAAHFPATLQLTRLTCTDSAPGTYYERKMSFISSFNSLHPSIVVGMSGKGTRYTNEYICETSGTGFTWSTETNPTSTPALYVGGTCEQLGDWRVYDNVYNLGFVKDGILAGRLKGGIGFNAGTHTKGDALFLMALWKRLFVTGCESYPEAAWLARLDVSNADPNWEELMKEVTVFGGVLTRQPLQVVRHNVDVGDQFNASVVELAVTNPNHGFATIRFRLSAPGNTTLSAYDITGRRVAVIFQGSLKPDVHTFRWDVPSHLNAGVYYINMTSGQDVRTQKTVLLR